LISWSRILAGGLRDPLVGAHVLIGVALGLGYTVLFLARDLTQERYGLLRTGGMTWMRDARHVAGTFLSNLVTPVVIALAIFLFFFLLRVVLRRQWIAGAALVILMAAPSLANAHPVIPLVFAIIQFGAAAWILVRFGVLPMVLGIFVSSVLPAIPLTTDFSSWYAGSTMFGLAVVLALTGYAFHTALAGRPMFTPGLLDAD